MAGRIRRHWKGLLATAVVLAAVLVVGVPYAYIHFIEGAQPPPLSLSDASPASTSAQSPDLSSAGASADTAAGDPTSSASSTATDTGAAASGITGTWTIGSGSQAGYRVHETLAGQSAVAVGRTDSVTGSLTIKGTTITAADVTVQVATIASDNSQRNRQFTGRIMDTADYPTATFTLTEPITLDAVPAVGDSTELSATGDLTLHGTTKPVTFPITVKRTDTGLAATGAIDITYQDYGIDNPSIGGFVSVGDSGTIEFLLLAVRG